MGDLIADEGFIEYFGFIYRERLEWRSDFDISEPI